MQMQAPKVQRMSSPRHLNGAVTSSITPVSIIGIIGRILSRAHPAMPVMSHPLMALLCASQLTTS